MIGHEKENWGDPIGAAYTSWLNATDEQRVRLMLETAIDLAMQGMPGGQTGLFAKPDTD